KLVENNGIINIKSRVAGSHGLPVFREDLSHVIHETEILICFHQHLLIATQILDAELGSQYLSSGMMTEDATMLVNDFVKFITSNNDLKTVPDYLFRPPLDSSIEAYFDPQYLQNLQTYKLDQHSDAYNVDVLLWEISSGPIPFESESPFGYDCDRYNSWEVKLKLLEHLEIIVEEIEKYAIEEVEIQQDKVDQRITIYKTDDRHSLLQDLFRLFIIQFNTTTNSMRIVNSLFNYFGIRQIDPSLIFNQLAYHYYNFNMIGYFQ
ncbi:2312_t:CDS:2, partial [Gigaspora margarita]